MNNLRAFGILYRMELDFSLLAPEHIEAVSAIEQLSFPSPWTRTLFEREISVPISHFFIAKNNDAVVGYGGYWLVAGEASIVNLAVHPDHRGRGFGRKILLFLIDDARASSAGSVFLEVRKGNRAAQCLYASCGFEASGVRAKYYGEEDAVVMKKTL